MTIETYLSDLGAYLQTNSIGTVGTDIFYGKFDLSTNCISLLPYPGTNTHKIVTGQRDPQQINLSILVRNSVNYTAKTKADSIYNLLYDIYNTIIGTTKFLYIQAKSPPGLVSSDSNFTIYSINFSLLIQ